MQSIQSAILKQPIIPGVTPIFLITLQSEYDEFISLSFSTHIQSKHNKSQKVKDYFHNQACQEIFRKHAQKTISSEHELKQRLLLHISAGIDSQEIWGIQCSHDDFFRYSLDSLFENAFYIFIYNSIQPLPEAYLKEAFEKINLFCRTHSTHSIIVDREHLVNIPEVVFSALPLDQKYIHPAKNNTTQDKLAIRNNHKKTHSNLVPMPIRLPEDLHPYHVLHSHHAYQGKNLIGIMLCYSEQASEVVLHKINQLYGSFLESPRIILYCKNKVIAELVQHKVCLYTQAGHSITIYDSIPTLKEFSIYLDTSSFAFVLIDQLTVDYSLGSIFMPLSPDHTIGFVTVGINELTSSDQAPTEITLCESILIKQSAWENIKNSVSIAEELLSISSLQHILIHHKICGKHLGGEIIPIQHDNEESLTLLSKQGTQKFSLSLKDKNGKTYTGIPFLENNLEVRKKVIALYQALHDTRQILEHVRTERDSLHEQSETLISRVLELEGHWVFKLKKKIQKFKRIFFRKKTPGKGTLKWLWEFFVFTFSKPGFRIVRRIIKNTLKELYLLAEDRPVVINYTDIPEQEANVQTYHDLVLERLNLDNLKKIYAQQKVLWKHTPKISIIVPVYNPPLKLLQEAIESVREQLYENWELCIADDRSTDPKIAKLLTLYASKDERIKFKIREENGHISACSNTALELVTGDYILLMDHDDLLSANCLSEVVEYINQHPEVDFIYSDEDKIDEAGHHFMPHFKPDWSPHSILTHNYIGHVVVLKKALMDKLGGFRLGFEGSQDYDLILRASEQTSRIGHIPKVLYHWRSHSLSAAQSEDVKPYAYIAAKKALEEALQRRNTPGTVGYLKGLLGYKVQYKITRPGKVSIIIPTKDQTALLKNAVDSILQHTDYKNYEILILNNNSKTKELFQFLEKYSQQYPGIVRYIDANFPFNFSKLMNLGVSHTDGEYILMLNNDVEIIESSWLETMVSFAQLEHTGAVGAKLLYPNDLIQHAGVIIGLGGIAGHSFVGFHKDETGYFNYLQSVKNYAAVTAACLMCRRDVYNKINGMDESFEIEYNDVDFCLKILDAGYYNVYLPQVELYHYESVTRGHPHKNKASWEKHVYEGKLFEKKWKKYIDRDPFYNPYLNKGVHDFSISFKV